MTLFKNIPDRSSFRNPVVTIGNFDGVHLGHQKILKALLDKARELDGDPIVVTFDAHPRKVLNPDDPPKIITTTDEKVGAITALGVFNVILLDFTKKMANMNAMDFYNRLLIQKLGAREIVIGYDHAFGKNREGDVEFLRELTDSTGMGVTRVDEEFCESKPVSSTWLRNEIMTGNFSMVSELLGRRYTLSGDVGQGAGRGMNLGFPTANIVPDDPDKIIPGDGVYAVTVYLKSSEIGKGMLNIGKNPTFANIERSIELSLIHISEPTET